jgi:tetratricopeptide (TPR) repeat protein
MERDVLLSRFRPWINGAAAGAAFLAVAALVLTCPLDGFLFTHLAAGDRILSLRSVPRAEEFSYTAYSLPWTDLSWLYQAGIAGVRRLGGLGAVGALHALLWLGIFTALYRRGRPGSSVPYRAAIVLFAAVGCGPWLRPGPEVVSWGLLLAALAILESAAGLPAGAEPAARSPRRRRVLLWGALPGLVLLWVNLHQGFILAVLATLLLAVDRALSALAREARQEGGPPAPMFAADLAFSVALQCGAALVNPFGARGLRLPFDAAFDPLGANALLARIFDDWRPVLSGGLPASLWLAAGLLALFALAVSLRRAGRGGAYEAVLLVVLLVLALRARRHLPPMVLVAAFLALRPRTLHPDDERRARWQAAAAAACVAAGIVVALAALRPSGLPPATRPAPSFLPQTDDEPELSARFVAGANLPGQVFHSLPVGGYLLDAWKRDRRIFADARREPFQHGALRGYLEAVEDEEAFERAADKYQITTVLWPHRDAEAGTALLRHLASGGRWRLASIDTAASVWVRVDAFTPVLARDAPIHGAEPLASLVPLLQAQLADRPRRGPPVREQALAQFFAAVGEAAGTEAFDRLALERAPRAAPLWLGLGDALEQRGFRDEARRAWEKAARLDARDGRAAAALGRMALADGNLEEARRRLDAAARAGDERPSTLAARGLLAERTARADEARSLFGAALRNGGSDREVLIAAAGFEGRRGELERALDLYARVRARRPDDPVAAAEPATLLEAAGRDAEAFDLVRGPAEGAVSRANVGGKLSAEDRRLLEVAARLARRADEPARAAEWEKALEKPSAVGGTTPGR